MAESTRCQACSRSRRTRVLVVQRAADLTPLKRWARRFDAVQVMHLVTGATDNAELQDALERDYLECGCGAGRIAGAITLAALWLFWVCALIADGLRLC